MTNSFFPPSSQTAGETHYHPNHPHTHHNNRQELNQLLYLHSIYLLHNNPTCGCYHYHLNTLRFTLYYTSLIFCIIDAATYLFLYLFYFFTLFLFIWFLIFIYFILYCCCYVNVEEPSLRFLLLCTVQ